MRMSGVHKNYSAVLQTHKLWNEIFANKYMKIRLQGNSIRFRLKQFEVEQFKEKGIVSEILSFTDEPQDQLEFVLRVSSANKGLLQQTGSRICLDVSARTAAEWTTTNMVGFEEKLVTEKGKEITILVEKDFKCLNRSEEDEVGSYPNPTKQC
jgi:hypothetical protein